MTKLTPEDVRDIVERYEHRALLTHSEGIKLDLARHYLAACETVEALRVFANCADELDREKEATGREFPDDEWAKFRLIVSDYRKARAALAKWEAGA